MKKKTKVFSIYYYISAAAVIAGIVISSAFYFYSHRSVETTIASNSSGSKETKNKVKLKEMNSENKIKPEPVEYTGITTKKNNPIARQLIKKGTKNESSFNNYELAKIEKEPVLNIQESEVISTEVLPEKTMMDPLAINSEEKNISPVVKPEIAPEQKNEYKSLKQLLVQKVKDKSGFKHNRSKNKVNGWEMLAVATKAFNKLTGRDIKLKENVNNDGEVYAYTISADKFEFSRRVK